MKYNEDSNHASKTGHRNANDTDKCSLTLLFSKVCSVFCVLANVLLFVLCICDHWCHKWHPSESRKILQPLASWSHCHSCCVRSVSRVLRIDFLQTKLKTFLKCFLYVCSHFHVCWRIEFENKYDWNHMQAHTCTYTLHQAHGKMRVNFFCGTKKADIHARVYYGKSCMDLKGFCTRSKLFLKKTF